MMPLGETGFSHRTSTDVLEMWEPVTFSGSLGTAAGKVEVRFDKIIFSTDGNVLDELLIND